MNAILLYWSVKLETDVPLLSKNRFWVKELELILIKIMTIEDAEVGPKITVPPKFA